MPFFFKVWSFPGSIMMSIFQFSVTDPVIGCPQFLLITLIYVTSNSAFRSPWSQSIFAYPSTLTHPEAKRILWTKLNVTFWEPELQIPPSGPCPGLLCATIGNCIGFFGGKHIGFHGCSRRSVSSFCSLGLYSVTTVGGTCSNLKWSVSFRTSCG